MEEFVSITRERAAQELQRLYRQQAAIDPVLELVGFLLEDGAGGVRSLKQIEVTTEQWLIWNRLALERPEALVNALNELLDEEQMELPSEKAAMRLWAAWLLVSTLERLEVL